MLHVLQGEIWDSSSPTTPLSFVTVKLVLGFGPDPEEALTSRGDFSVFGGLAERDGHSWDSQTDSDGHFVIALTEGDVETILSGRRYREVVLKVYNSSGFLLGCHPVHVSLATFRGNESVGFGVQTSTPSTPGTYFAVSGVVTEVDGTPIASTTVELDRKDLRSTTPLGSTTTDDDGHFTIYYLVPSGTAYNAPFSTVVTAASVSAAAGDICNPPKDFTVRLVRDDDAYRGPSDFELDVATLEPLLDTATFDELTVDDVEHLMCRTQHDSGIVATLVRAHSLADTYSLPAAAFVAFAHAGIPLGTNVITGLSEAEIEAAIDHAVASNVVPSSLASDKAAITAALAAARIDRMVRPDPNEDETTLGAILLAASLTPGLPRSFAELYAAHTGTAAQFWQALREHEDFDEEGLVERIQFTPQLQKKAALGEAAY